MALYENRHAETYTEGSLRWWGIQHKIHPPAAPRYSDCSASATWVYWTVFGNGKDILNGANWGSGYTGTMVEHGHDVPLSSAQPGDLVFYGRMADGHTPSHVAIYKGHGKVVSHGSDPVGIYDVHYRTDFRFVRRYF